MIAVAAHRGDPGRTDDRIALRLVPANIFEVDERKRKVARYCVPAEYDIRSATKQRRA
jgi:hypothetical protein